MKYVRTKDGHRYIRLGDRIFDLEHLPSGIWFDGETLKDNADYDCADIYTNRFRNQADTIEELCDCFIAVDKNGNLCENPMIAKGHCFKSFCNYYKANEIDVDCYLAILTDKGLIYVAKMNDKGELELL